MDYNRHIDGLFRAVTSARNQLPLVTGIPKLVLSELLLLDSDFVTLLYKIKTREQLSFGEKKRWQEALGLVAPFNLPDDPDSWMIVAIPAEPPDQAKYVHELGGLDESFLTKYPSYKEQVTYLMSGAGTERDWQTVFPFRVKGDAGLRRLRLSDLPIIFPQAEKVLLLLYNCRNYIFVLNICIATMVCKDFDYAQWFSERGGFNNIPTYLGFSKTLTIQLKGTLYNNKYLMLVEGSGMAGFRLLPDPTFDIVAATKDSATGLGLAHTTVDGVEPWGWSNCVSYLRVLPKPHAEGTHIKSFEEFLSEPSLWTTSGSSSVGRLRLKVDGKWKSIKARKLLLPYIFSLSDIIKEAKRTGTTHAVSVVKSELAKIRVAVASDLAFYLIWSYIHHVYGDVYQDWPGVTLGETVAQESQRLHDMLVSTEGTYGFPADFEGFDKQPLTDEVAIIGCALVACAEIALPMPDWLKKQAIYGLLNSILSTPRQPDGSTLSFTVKNYLPSGIFITSAVGNAFNSIATKSMILLVEAWTGIHHIVWLINLELRGDDSSFVVTHVGFCYLLSLAAKMMNYVHARFKVSVLYEATEFLRISITHAHGCRGYPARLVPAISQRKPWSNEPWDPEGVIRAQWDTCKALTRRLQNGERLWEGVSRVWAKKRGLPVSVLTASNIDGGLGIGPADNVAVFISPSLTTVLEVPLDFMSSGWAKQQILKRYLDLNIPISSDTASKLLVSELTAALSTVDLPEYARKAQAEYKLQLPTIKVYPRQSLGLVPRFRALLESVCEHLKTVSTPLDFFNLPNFYKPTQFGKYRHLTNKVLAIRAIKKYESINLNEYIFEVESAKMARSLSCSRSIAEDWLLGSAPTLSFHLIHPTLTDTMVPIAVYLVEMSRLFSQIRMSGLGVVCRLVSWQIGRALFSSDFHQRLYQW